MLKAGQKIHKGKVYNYKNNYNHTIPKIAYISNDFHDHATMHLMAGLFGIKIMKILIIMQYLY